MSNIDLDPNGIHNDDNSPEPGTRLMGAVTLAGQKVYNHENEDLGEIKEIVIYIETGEVVYAVLSFGGLLGMGDKLFAVPWHALHLDVPNQRVIVDISKRKLQKLPGFNKDRWPEWPNPQFVEPGSRDGRRKIVADEQAVIRTASTEAMGKMHIGNATFISKGKS